jgi:hypothetical protein
MLRRLMWPRAGFACSMAKPLLGWSIDGEARVVGGVLVLGGTRTTTAVSPSLGGGEVQLRLSDRG